MEKGSVILLHKMCLMWDTWLHQWLLPTSLRWNRVWIVCFAHPYLTFNSSCWRCTFLSLFLFTIAHVFPIRATVKRCLPIESLWGAYHEYTKYVFGLLNIFWSFLVDSSPKKSLLYICEHLDFLTAFPFRTKQWMKSVNSQYLSDLIIGVCTTCVLH